MLPVLQTRAGPSRGPPQGPAVHVPTAAETTVLRALRAPGYPLSSRPSPALRERTWRAQQPLQPRGRALRDTTGGRSRAQPRGRTGEARAWWPVPRGAPLGVPVLSSRTTRDRGYPVIAVVLPQDLPLAAQLLPGLRCGSTWSHAHPGDAAPPSRRAVRRATG
ncbi:hypothetical protein QJS66_12165 [Kocuria rhizophila]|nr:hypothetical protein QJS66_12165 [Kocuria rhizophila]